VKHQRLKAMAPRATSEKTFSRSARPLAGVLAIQSAPLSSTFGEVLTAFREIYLGQYAAQIVFF
jgi:hypothetical protein